MGRASRFRFTALKLGPGWNDRPAAGRGLLLEVDLRTSVRVDFQPVALEIADEALFRHPLLFLSGDRPFPLPPEDEIARLADFLRYGGMLVTDSATGRDGEGFDASVRRLAAALFPDRPLEPLPFENTLFKSYYRIRTVAGRLAAKPALEAVVLEDRAALVHSLNDLHGAWSVAPGGRYAMQPEPGGEAQRRLALALGVNLVLYALTVNYKSDQVHAAYRLRRRMLPW
jgi:hypothetical protein